MAGTSQITGANRASLQVPRVSIIILNWNSYEVTRDCLVSLGRSDYANFEIILVDNGSRDSSPDRLSREFPSVRLIKNNKNLGFTGGNNVGMRDALGRDTDYLLLLNNDTEVAPDFLSQLVGVAESDPEIGVLNPKIYFYQPADMIWYGGGVHKPWWSFPRHIGVFQRDSDNNGLAQQVTFITGCALLIKTQIARQVGLLDETFFIGFEDADWSKRVMQAGYKAVYVPAAKIWHKISVDTKKNLGKPVKDFYYVRNSILLARKHLRQRRYWPLYWLSLAKYLAYRTAGYTLRLEPARVLALYKGVWSGCSTPIMGPISIPERRQVFPATDVAE